MNAKDLVYEKLGRPGRLISGSKSLYRNKYPNNFVIFNSNICTKTEKLWYGDVDLTLDKNTLLEISVLSGEDLYVFYEFDARFEKEKDFNLKDAAVKFGADGKIEINEKYKKFYSL